MAIPIEMLLRAVPTAITTPIPMMIHETNEWFNLLFELPLPDFWLIFLLLKIFT